MATPNNPVNRILGVALAYLMIASFCLISRPVYAEDRPASEYLKLSAESSPPEVHPKWVKMFVSNTNPGRRIEAYFCASGAVAVSFPVGEKKDGEQLRGDDFMDELDRRIQALTPEDMLDTSEEDARTQENFKQADRLHEEELRDKGQ